MIKYPSLDNHYNIAKSKYSNVMDNMFYATEKNPWE